MNTQIYILIISLISFVSYSNEKTIVRDYIFSNNVLLEDYCDLSNSILVRSLSDDGGAEIDFKSKKIILNKQAGAFNVINLSTQKVRSTPAIKFDYSFPQLSVLNKNNIFYVRGASPQKVRMVKHDLNDNKESFVKLGKNRNPIFQLSPTRYICAWWFNQDPAKERRAGWVGVVNSPVFKIDGKNFCKTFVSTKNIDSNEYYQAVSIVDENCQEKTQIFKTEESSSISEVTKHPSKNEIIFAEGQYGINIHHYNFETKTLKSFKVDQSLDLRSPIIWLHNHNSIVFCHFKNEKQAFACMNLETQKIIDLPVQGTYFYEHANFFLTEDEQFVYKSKKNIISVINIKKYISEPTP